MAKMMSRRQLLAAGMTGLAGATLAEMVGCGTSRSSLAQATATAAPPMVTATPAVRPMSMVITGDVMLGRSVNQQMVAAGTDGTFPFTQTGDFLRGFDLAVGNLECVVSKIGSPIPGKPFTFRADPLGFSRLQSAGFDVVSVANNHSGDYGPEAFADMLGHLPQYGITAIGGGLNHDAAHTPVIVEHFGTRIGFVAACDIDPPTFAATATQPGHAWLDDAGLRHDIPIARAQSDFLIVFTHWGVEYHLNYNAQQQELAHLAIDLGADLVVGAHPHDIEPNEIYRGKPIIYSLGNFVFDEMYDSESHGNVLTLRVQGSTLLDWKLVPITIDTTTGAPHLA